METVGDQSQGVRLAQFQERVRGPLTDPTAHGGRAEDAFDLVDAQRGRARTNSHPGRDARRHHALLAHEQRDVCRAALLGERRQHFNEVDKGGHFAAWEQPQLFAAELRAAFRSLR